MIKTLKAVTAQEMSRIEQKAFTEGAQEKSFMENAGQSIAQIVSDFITEHKLEKKITLLAGKGNNGGDAFATGTALLDKGFSISAWHIYHPDVCSPLCRHMRELFEKKGGTIHTASDENSFHFHPEGIIVDGLVGTGFTGKAQGILALAIERANDSGLPIIAIDIPSGLNATSGHVESIAIHATLTIYLEMPKIGFFIKNGWDHIGHLIRGHFGLDEKYIKEAHPIAYLLDTDSIFSLLPPIKRTRHKYEAGYVLAFAGSKEMPGAAILSSFSSLLGGAGLVRLFYLSDISIQFSAAPFEILKEEWNGISLKRIRDECHKAKAMLIGPGMGRSIKTQHAIKLLLKNIALPSVIDADALFFLAQHPDWPLSPQCILTPHRGEMQMLLSSFAQQASDPIQSYVDMKGVTLVLKGAPTFVFSPNEPPLIITRGSPGMATAGSGDVLTGLIAAMLAQGLEPKIAAYVATALHGIAGEIAVERLTCYCMTATDIMQCLSDAFSLHSTN